MAHTPGPWIAGWSGDSDTEGKDEGGPLNIIAVGRGGVAVCEPIPTGHASTWEIVEANAHLIAAAPELLAKCHKIVEWLTKLADRSDQLATETSGRFDAYADANRADAKNYRAVITDINTVIAKAEGRNA